MSKSTHNTHTKEKAMAKDKKAKKAKKDKPIVEGAKRVVLPRNAYVRSDVEGWGSSTNATMEDILYLGSMVSRNREALPFVLYLYLASTEGKEFADRYQDLTPGAAAVVLLEYFGTNVETPPWEDRAKFVAERRKALREVLVPALRTWRAQQETARTVA